MLHKFTTIFAAVLFLTACGQTGPLYLPEHPMLAPRPAQPLTIQPIQNNHA